MTEAKFGGARALRVERVAVLINRKARTVRLRGSDAVADMYRAALGPTLTGVYTGTGRDMFDLAARAIDDGAQIILPIGGDGTCTAIAEIARGRALVSSALPGGTKNILARRLWGEEATLESIAAQLAAQAVELRHMDAGEANGRLFFVGASFGLIPHLARARERLRGRAQPSGFWPALRHVLRLGRRGLFSPRVSYVAPDREPGRCAGLMVSVKSIDEMLFRPGEKHDPASFDCAAASPQGWLQLIWLAFRAIFTDTWRRHARVEDFNVPQLQVTGRSRLAVALDGETLTLASPIDLRLLQDAIPMIGAAR